MEDRLLEELLLKKMEIKDALMELERLKENETVKRYLELLEYDTEQNRKFVLKSNDEMIEELDSDNIYYCLGKGFVGYVQKNGEYHILSHSFNDFRLFAIYKNLEDSKDEIVILKDESDLFEKEHRTITSKTDSPYVEYEEAAIQYNTDCLNDGVDVATRKLYKKYN